MADLEKIAEDLSSLTVLEAAELSKMLEEKWGVQASAGGGMMMMPGAMPGAAAAESDDGAAEEKTEFDVILSSFGEKNQSTSSRKCAPLPAWASRKPRIWSKVRRSRSRKGPAKTKPRKSRKSWRKSALRSSSNSSVAGVPESAVAVQAAGQFPAARSALCPWIRAGRRSAGTEPGNGTLSRK